MNKLSTKLVVAIGIGAALYGILGLWGFSIAPNTFIKPALAILTVFGALFGPVAGLLIGLIGHTVTDTIAGWGFGGDGLLVQVLLVFNGAYSKRVGFSVKTGHLRRGYFLFSNYWASWYCHCYYICWGIRYYCDGEPFDKIVIQVLGATISDVIVFLVLGLPLTIGLAKSIRNIHI